MDDFKSAWQHAAGGSIDEQRLQMMTKINQHPTLKNLRLKLVVEAVSLTALLLVYYDAFDGDKKPFFVNAFLVFSLLLYITNNVLGYILIKNPIKADNILNSVQKQILVLRRLSFFSLASSVVYAVSLLLFFFASIEFTSVKYMFLGGLVLSFAIMFYFSYQKWKGKIDHFSKVLTRYMIDIA